MLNNTKFITFYSYKGGVGRTSAIVNSAILRAEKGNSVLVIDFDLEAPGTGSYFSQLDNKYDGNKPGILDYLVEAIEKKEVPSIKKFATDLSHKIDKSNGGELWVIGAGDVTNSSYHKNLEKLKWSDIFQNNNGELLLKNLQNQIKAEFDHPDMVFLDSRTGITETGGVCTRYLADIVVILTSLNEQNILGTSKIYKDLKEDKSKKFLLVASNIPVGFPIDEEQLFGSRIKNFQEMFNAEPNICIYNYPSLSLNEFLPVKRSQNKKSNKLFRSIYEADPLIKSYTSLSEELGGVASDSLSYLSMVESVSWYIFFGKENRDEEILDIFKEMYSKRLLGSLLLKLIETNDSIRPKEFTKEQSDNFKFFCEQIESTTNSNLLRGLGFVKRNNWQTAKNLMTSDNAVEMRKEWEVFADDHELTNHVPYELSKGHTSWATDYLLRKFISRNDQEDTYEIVRDAFHLAMGLKKNNDPRYFGYFKMVSDQSDKLEMNGAPLHYQAYYHFRFAIAASELSHEDQKEYHLRLTIEKATASDDKATFFSPTNFKKIGKPTFIELATSYSKNNNKLITTSNSI